MADRRSTLLAAVSFAAIILTLVALIRPATAADMSATPQSAEPDLSTKKLAVPVTAAVPGTTAAPPARGPPRPPRAPPRATPNTPLPPRPPPHLRPATVDAAARETGNPINKPV